jgi:hypothetical protein
MDIGELDIFPELGWPFGYPLAIVIMIVSSPSFDGTSAELGGCDSGPGSDPPRSSLRCRYRLAVAIEPQRQRV